MPAKAIGRLLLDQVAEKCIVRTYIFPSDLQMNPHLRLFIVADLPRIGSYA